MPSLIRLSRWFGRALGEGGDEKESAVAVDVGVDVAGGTQSWSERGGDEDPWGGGSDDGPEYFTEHGEDFCGDAAAVAEFFSGGGGDVCAAADFFSGDGGGNFEGVGTEIFTGVDEAADDESFCGGGCCSAAEVETLAWSLIDGTGFLLSSFSFVTLCSGPGPGPFWCLRAWRRFSVNALTPPRHTCGPFLLNKSSRLQNK